MTTKPKSPPVRTLRQNRALHLWLRKVAKELNEGGYTVKLVMAQKMDIDWTGELAKELLWRPAQKVILGKESTAKLSKSQEIDMIFDHLNRHLGEKFGVHVGWPHYETEEEYVKSTLA